MPPPPLPGSPEAFLDRFDSVEGLSGSSHSDILRGDDALAVDMVGHELNNIALIDGLQALLGANVTQFTGGNIMLGGDGSDIIEGRAGNDLIDGDKWLNVRLSIRNAAGVELDTVDNMMGELSNIALGWAGRNLNELMLSGEINPGQIHIVREILTAEDATDDTDTAVFTGNFANYTIGQPDTNGRVTVVDNVGTDGVDVLLGIERLQFADLLITTPGGNEGPVGELTLSDTSPTEDQPLTVSAVGVTDPDNPGGTITGPITYYWQVDDGNGGFTDILTTLLGEEVPVTGTSFRPGDAEVGLALRVRALYQDAEGVIEQVFSAPTDPVININDAPTGAPIISDPTPTEGLALTVATAGIVDIDGLGAPGFTFQWQQSALGGGTVFNNIGGATNQLFTPAQGQVNRQLRVVVTFTDDGGFTETVTSVATTVVGDQIIGNNNGQTHNGTAGEDIISARGGNDTLNGLAGNDILNGENGNDNLNGGLGADTLDGGANNDNLNGGAGNDLMTGGTGTDTAIYAAALANYGFSLNNAGNLLITDLRAGSPDGVDTLIDVEQAQFNGQTSELRVGTNGADTITVNGGSDLLIGLGGNDILSAGGAADFLIGGAGNDTLNGGNGGDTALFTGQVANYGFSLVGANVVVTDNRPGSPDGADTLNSIETVQFGLQSLDLNAGTNANNNINANGGNDLVLGFGGNDELTGGTGADVLVGGVGADGFNYDDGHTGVGVAARDIILDFLSGTDNIDLSAVDANTGVGGGGGNGQAFTFIGTGAFTAAAQLRFQQIDTNADAILDSTLIQGNVNAALTPDLEILLQNYVGPLLVSDFVL